MNRLYKIGFWLIGILFILVVPMFTFLQEMAIMFAINAGIFGLVLVLAYFLLAFLYIRFGKNVFLTGLCIVVLVPVTLFLYGEWKENHDYEMWRDFSEAKPIEVNRTITEEDGAGSEEWDKYSFSVPHNGNIEAVSERFAVELGLTIFNSSREPISYSTADGKGVVVENAQKGETYYLLIEKNNKKYTVQLKFVQEKAE